MSVNGSYVLEKNENFEAFMRACGAKEDRIQKMMASKPTLVIELSGDQLTITSHYGGEEKTNNITLGVDSEIVMAGGATFTVNINMSGNTGSGTFTKGSTTGDISFDFGETHLVQTLTSGDLSAKRYFKRK